MARFYAYPYSSPLLRTLLISFLLVFCAGISAYAQTVPSISSISEMSGPVGKVITITGSGFSEAHTVSIGSGSTYDFKILNSGTTIEVAVPASASNGSIRVSSNYGTGQGAGQFTVTGAPVVSSFTPEEAVGNVITITGSNFTGATSVSIGSGSTTSFSVSSNGTVITATVPASASNGSIRVSSNYGTGQGAGQFTVTGAPTIASFTPASGPVGTEVTITGTNLNTVAHVNLGPNGWIAASSLLYISEKEIKFIVPSSANSAILRVLTDKGQTSNSNRFIVTGAPTITSFTPASGPVGTEVTITGTNLNTVAHVNLGPNGWIAASNFTSVTNNQIKFIVPNTASTALLRVLSPYGQFVSNTFTIEGAPTITSFTPASGPVGTEVTITGTNLNNTNYVYIGNGSVSSVNFLSISTTELKLIVPSSTTTDGKINIRSPKGQVSSTGTYTLTSPYLTTPQELTFNSKPIGGSESKEYQVSGLGLKNGEAVTLTVSESSPYTISKTPDAAGFGKTITLTGVTNNRLNPTTIFVKYTSAEAGEGFPAVIMHTQGSVTRGMDVRVVAPLPVELTSFTASLKGSVVNLQWTTASEKDNSHFEIEMSKGSLSNFRKIDIVKSKVENSSTKTQYSFSSYYSSNGETEYYRLRQVDLDGSYAYSKIVAVKPVMISKPMEVAPNPLEADSKVYFTTENNGKATIRVTSINGKQVYFEQIDVHAGENAVLLSKYNNLMAGVYIVTVEHSGKREYVRIEKR